MVFTLPGIITDLMELPENAFSPMAVTLLGMTVPTHPSTRVFDAVLMIALQLLRES